MENFESMSQSTGSANTTYVFIPKYRRKVIYDNLRAAIGRILRSFVSTERKRSGVSVSSILVQRAPTFLLAVFLCVLASEFIVQPPKAKRWPAVGAMALK